MKGVNIDTLRNAREHNQLEVKSAKGGFPNSFWETYSAFANSDGGIILLGVKENKNGVLHSEPGIDVEKLRKDFWNMVNNRQKISANIVTDSMVFPDVFDDNNILVVTVPRADRAARPVYVGMDPKSGSFRRNHEGDYHCSLDEVSLMFRDAAIVTVDSKVLKNMDSSVFCADTVKDYRNFFRSTHRNHLWNNEDDEIFLRKIGAIGIADDGTYHPTAAGLLMFGYEYEITREFPNFFLDYQENRSLGATRWTDRIISTSGDWSGNVFDFVQKVLPKLQSGLKIPFVLQGNTRVDETPIHKLLREALTNTCVHADFYGRQGLVVQKFANTYKFANPGTIRISITEAVNGGVSDPRNGVMLKMFSLIEFGERAGSGLSGIYHVWERVYHKAATITETHNSGVDRTTLTLSTDGNEEDIDAMLELYGDMIEDNEPQNMVNEPQNVVNGPQSNQKHTPKVTTKDDFQGKSSQKNKKSNQKSNPKEISGNQKSSQKILSCLKMNPKMTISELANALNMSESGIKKTLKSLKQSGFIQRIGPDKGGHWKVME